MTRSLTRLRRAAVSAILFVLVLSALARIVSAGLATLPEDGTAPAPDPTDAAALLCPPSDEISGLLRHIAARGAELDRRLEAVALREQDATIAREEIRAALAEMAAARAALEARMYASDTASEEDVARLVSMYEGMKPKDAAALFETMESGFAAGFLARMRPEAAAAILSNIPPDKAYALSVWIAGRNAGAATEDGE